MNPLKTMRVAGLAAAIAMGTVGAAHAAPITPTFDVFGTLSGATFGGSGIPNDAVAITTINAGNDTITLGLTATPRFANPAVGNDGAGNFTALPGSNVSPPPSSTLGGLWNFSFYIDIAGGGTFGNYGIELLYDLDSGAGTDESAHGVIDFNFGGALSGNTLFQGSQNPLFSFLSMGAPGVTPPGGTFDPDAPGEYTFALRVSSAAAGPLGEASIRVNVVPEPATLALMGLGLAGIGLSRRRKRA